MMQSELPLISIKKKRKTYFLNVPKDLGEITLEIHRSRKENSILTFKKKEKFPARWIGKKLKLITTTNQKGIIIYNRVLNQY